MRPHVKRAGAFRIGVRRGRGWGVLRRLVRSGAVKRYVRQQNYRRVFGRGVSKKPFRR